MKASSFFAATLILSISLYCTQTIAQSSVGIAADPQKQAGLEKNKAHQAEMEKKYKAMTPEQQKEAKKKAADYKNGGYKNKSAQGTTSKPAQAPAAKTSQTGVTQAKTTPAKPATTSTQSGTNTKPIFLDANGKPVNTNTPATTTKPTAGSAKTAPVKPAVESSTKAVQKAPAAEPAKK